MPETLFSLALVKPYSGLQLSAGRSWSQNSRVLIGTLDGVFNPIRTNVIKLRTGGKQIICRGELIRPYKSLTS